MKKAILSDRDIKCMTLLWNWKFLSTAAINLSVYRFENSITTYERLRILKIAGYIEPIATKDTRSYFWQLTEKGYQVIHGLLPNLKESGFKSENKYHDFFVTAVHLGDWISGIPKNSDIFSEQCLRRIDREEYPNWVPPTSDHRPDGWWLIAKDQPSEKSLIALEVEISKKTAFMYNEVAQFYSSTVKPYQVLWIVKTNADKNYIHRHLRVGDHDTNNVHSFVFLDEYIKMQWQAKIVLGKNIGKNISDILNQYNKPGHGHGHGVVFFDTRKKRAISTSRPNFKDLVRPASNSYLF